MKKSILLSLIVCFAIMAHAQNDKYIQAMKKNIAQLDSIMAKGNAQALANNFTRIGNAEKDKWLPYYYAAYVIVTQAYTEQDKSKLDAYADKANELITKASAILGKESSEIDVIKSMIANAHMLVDPQSRYMTYGPEINQYIESAMQLDSTNPRPVLLKAQGIFYTPEAFGGGKEAAKPLFERAAYLFEHFIPSGKLMPTWGRGNLNYFMKQYNQK